MQPTAQMAGYGLLGAVLCFVVASALAVLEVRRGTTHSRLPTLLLMGGGFLLLTLYLQYQGQVRGRCPITTPQEILIFLSWSTVLIYFVVGPSYRLSLLGVFTAPLVAAFVALGMAGGAVATGPAAPPDTPVDPWLEFHASVSLISYGAFALAFVAAVMFFIQDRLLKRRSLTPLFYNLPPISNLSGAVLRLALVGFVLLTAGIASAFFLRHFPGWGKVLISVPVWLGYGALLATHYLRRPLGPKGIAKAATLLFALPLITLTILGRH